MFTPHAQSVPSALMASEKPPPAATLVKPAGEAATVAVGEAAAPPVPDGLVALTWKEYVPRWTPSKVVLVAGALTTRA